MPRILLIDDDEAVRRLLAEVLTSVGHDVTFANDGHQAVSSFRAAPADLVVTDLTMPIHDGIEVITTFKREFPDTPIIAMSGESTKSPKPLAARKLGAVAVLEKPFSISEFLGVIGNALQH
jgi:CheY-like chemotaxis protein